MRIAAILVAVLMGMLSLLALPARIVRSDGERVVLDTVVIISPARSPISLCMEIEPGTLTTTIQSVGDPNARVGFSLDPQGSGTFPGEYINTMVPTATVTYQTAVRQTPTCVGL